MSNLPPKRTGQQRPASSGAPRGAQAAPPARSNRKPPARQAPPPEQYYDEDEQYDQYEDQYEPDERQYRNQRPPQRQGYAQQPPRSNSYNRSGAPSRYGPPPRYPGGQPRRQPPRYVAPRRDIFPIAMGALVGMFVVGLMVVIFLLLNRPSTVANTPPANTGGSVDTGVTPQSTMIQVNGNAAQQTMEASRPANGIGTAVPNEGNTHVDEGQAITYTSYPPSSGTHYGTTADYGFSAVEIPEGKFVHSMEHGAIVLYYKPDVSDAIKQQLKDTYTKLPAGKYGKVKMVIVPYTKGMNTPLAIAAWDRLLLMNEYNFDEIQTFYQTWVDKGPEDVP